MEKTKVSIIKANSEEELAKKINESEFNIFATTPMQKNDETWVAFIYYKIDSREEGKSMSFSTSNQENNYSFQPRNRFIPTQEQLDKWKDEDVTEKQTDSLLKLGLKDKEIRHMSKLEAYQFISKNKKRN